MLILFHLSIKISNFFSRFIKNKYPRQPMKRYLLIFLLPFSFIQAQKFTFTEQSGQVNLDYEVGAYTVTDQHGLLIDSIFTSISTESLIIINGYADNLGSHSANLELSENRTKQIRQYLLNKGFNPNNIKIQNHGEKYISESETSESIKQKNLSLIHISEPTRPY